MRRVFDRETAAVGAPENFIIGVRAFFGTKGMNHAAILHRERRAVRVRVMEEQMGVQAENLIAGGKTEDAQSRLIDKGADAIAVNAINSLGSRFEDEANPLFLVAKPLFRLLSLSDDGPEDQ